MGWEVTILCSMLRLRIGQYWKVSIALTQLADRYIKPSVPSRICAGTELREVIVQIERGIPWWQWNRDKCV